MHTQTYMQVQSQNQHSVLNKEAKSYDYQCYSVSSKP